MNRILFHNIFLLFLIFASSYILTNNLVRNTTLYKETNYTQNKIGYYTSTLGNVRIKKFDQLAWFESSDIRSVNEYDMIFTSDKSYVYLNLKNNVRIQVTPNSLVQITGDELLLSNGKITIDVPANLANSKDMLTVNKQSLDFSDENKLIIAKEDTGLNITECEVGENFLCQVLPKNNHWVLAGNKVNIEWEPGLDGLNYEFKLENKIQKIGVRKYYNLPTEKKPYKFEWELNIINKDGVKKKVKRSVYAFTQSISDYLRDDVNVFFNNELFERELSVFDHLAPSLIIYKNKKKEQALKLRNGTYQTKLSHGMYQSQLLFRNSKQKFKTKPSSTYVLNKEMLDSPVACTLDYQVKSLMLKINCPDKATAYVAYINYLDSFESRVVKISDIELQSTLDHVLINGFDKEGNTIYSTGLLTTKSFQDAKNLKPKIKKREYIHQLIIKDTTHERKKDDNN